LADVTKQNYGAFCMKKARALLFFIAISLSTSVVPVQANSNEGITAITVPGADITLSFVQLGIISKVLIKEGDKIGSIDGYCVGYAICAKSIARRKRTK